MGILGHNLRVRQQGLQSRQPGQVTPHPATLQQVQNVAEMRNIKVIFSRLNDEYYRSLIFKSSLEAESLFWYPFSVLVLESKSDSEGINRPCFGGDVIKLHQNDTHFKL